jgi:hypothetical protein
MKGGTRAAAALAIGYVLGRRKRLRTATLMTVATAVGGTTVGGIVLKRGMKMLNSTEAFGKIAPQLSEITDTVRGDLLTAAKDAASAAVTSRIDTFTDSLHDRADRLRNPGETVAEGAGEAAEAGRAATRTGRRAASGAAGRATSTVGGTARRMTGRGRARDEDEYEGDEYEAAEPEEEAGETDEYEDEPRDYEADEAEGGEADEDEPEPEAPPRRGAARRRAPVTRARR